MDTTGKLPEQRKLPIEWLQRGQFQPRQFFDSDKLDELAETIKQCLASSNLSGRRQLSWPVKVKKNHPHFPAATFLL